MGNDNSSDRSGFSFMLSHQSGRSQESTLSCRQCEKIVDRKEGHYICSQQCKGVICKSCGENNHPEDHVIRYVNENDDHIMDGLMTNYIVLK